MKSSHSMKRGRITPFGALDSLIKHDLIKSIRRGCCAMAQLRSNPDGFLYKVAFDCSSCRSVAEQGHPSYAIIHRHWL